ncbi:phage virion morphogenesis protein [Castellaniella hirudinis]|uniref:phage virion morphogenesis protein n=1 Tax=Castellaniella hirudinis TaxID=1144617 RepID=UPI0039C21DE7
MAGTHIEVSADTAAIEATLARAVQALGSPNVLLLSVGEEMLNATRDRFKNQQSPDGAKWAALLPAYQKSKEKNQNKILTLDGYLGGTLRYQVDGAAVEVGSNLEYAAIHQFGGTIKPKKARALKIGDRHVGAAKIPARPFLGMNADDEVRILELAQDFMQNALIGK